MKKQSIETRLVHSGEPRPRIEGAVTLPIFQSATFEWSGTTDYHEIRYGRLSNTPNHVALHDKLADIESAEAALVASSGMAAISTSLLTVLSAGDHLLAQNVLYGGTFDFVTKDLPSWGIELDLVDGHDPEEWKEKLRPNTRAFYVETISNPLMTVSNLDEAARFAREHNLLSFIDNTFASPINFRPAEHGFDLSLHSATKYLNGHSDLIAGAIIGRREVVDRVKIKLDHLGGSLDPHACFLLNRGLKTLGLRIAYQNASAQALAEALESFDRVRAVHYSGLPGHRDHQTASRLLDGFGGMISSEIDGSGAEVQERIDRLTIATDAPSLGGPETLVTIPANTSHAGMTPEERKMSGIAGGLIRVSVGLEGTQDLIDDFRQALS